MKGRTLGRIKTQNLSPDIVTTLIRAHRKHKAHDNWGTSMIKQLFQKFTTKPISNKPKGMSYTLLKRLKLLIPVLQRIGIGLNMTSKLKVQNMDIQNNISKTMSAAPSV